MPAGTRKPTTEWPIQKYLWSDFMVGPGDVVAYAVAPMIGPAQAMKEGRGSGWSPVVTIGTETAGHATCFFNRGIVASQWLARQLPDANPGAKLMEVIATPGDRIRDFLGGPLREKLVDLLKTTHAKKGHVYAALFELGDPELVPLLAAFGTRAHVVLGNGSVKRKGENEDARTALAGCDLHDRMSAPRALAASYRDQWKALAAAGDASPPSLFEADARPRTPATAEGTTLWFTPLHGALDLEEAGKLIAEAGDKAAGKKRATACPTCHGLGGLSTLPEAPNLAGQVEPYLVKVLTEYREGKRENEIMTVVAKELSDADISNLAAYYSGIQVDVLPPG